MTIGLGCMRLSTDRARDPVRGQAVITAAVEAGIGVLDTADAYAWDDSEVGHNERLIASALAELPVRPPVQIVTKGGLVRPDGAWVPDGRAKHLAAAARASRARLGLDAIDLYLLHVVDPKTPLATSVRALARLRDDGIVRQIGLSNVGLLQLEAAQQIAPLDAVEVELSPWQLDALRGGLVAACAAAGIRVLAYRPLGGPAGVRRAAADPVLVAIGARLGASPAELVLAWLCSLSPAIVPLPGATRTETALSAARAAQLALDAEARSALADRFVAPGARPDWPPPASPRSRGASAATRTSAEPLGSSEGSDLAAEEPSATTPARRGASTVATDIVGALGSPATPPNIDAAAAPKGFASTPSATDAAGGPATPARASGGAGPGDTGDIVVVLGMPGSGKSTVAADYVARGYLRLNRDELGGTLAMIAQRLERELARGARRVVLDNTYPSRASRAQVIDVARRHGAAVRCLAMATSLEDAQANAVARILDRHGRLLMPGGSGTPDELARAKEIDPRAQYRFRRDYEPPRDDEGFAAIEQVPFVRRPGPAGAPALIVELDGIVWRKRPATAAALELCDGAAEALQAWSSSHVLAATTWLPGLASCDELADRLRERLGLPLHVMHCAHAAGPPVCWCRKPLPGLALALARAHGLDLARSLHLGKGPADRGFALRAGMRYADIAAGWPVPDRP